MTTWNMNWLTLRSAGDKEVPADIPFRSKDDYAHLKLYADRLKSDVIAVEEVENEAALRKIFDPHRYHFILSQDRIVQRVAVVVRNNLSVTTNPDITALNVKRTGARHALRSGLDVTIHDGHYKLRLLAIHLKSGCWAQLLSDKAHSCPLLARQLAIVKDWILDREKEHSPYMVLGDFNRRFTLNDPAYLSLSQQAPLTLVTAGLASPCRGGSRFIDHILLGGTARNWLVPDSLRVMIFRFDQNKDMISDHCPVSATLDLP